MYSIRQRALAEVFGTAALVLVGPGSVIATLALAGKAVPAVTEADLLGISFAFGFIITALLAHSKGDLGHAIAICGIGSLVAAILLVPRLPESVALRLDDLSPTDTRPPEEYGHRA